MGLSPGFDKGIARFERPILSDCLFCHANRSSESQARSTDIVRRSFGAMPSAVSSRHGPVEMARSSRSARRHSMSIEETSPGDAEPNRPTRSSFVNFHRDVMNEQDRALTERTIAVSRYAAAAARRCYGSYVPLLQAAVAAAADGERVNDGGRERAVAANAAMDLAGHNRDRSQPVRSKSTRRRGRPKSL